MYSQTLGRFVSRDPSATRGQPDVLYDNNDFGDRLTLMANLFAYGNNNPLNEFDPSGEQPIAFRPPRWRRCPPFCAPPHPHPKPPGLPVQPKPTYPIPIAPGHGTIPTYKPTYDTCSGSAPNVADRVADPDACPAGTTPVRIADLDFELLAELNIPPEVLGACEPAKGVLCLSCSGGSCARQGETCTLAESNRCDCVRPNEA
jgi:RHS repeat-associated protein